LKLLNSLYRLKPYFRRHRWLLAAGFIAILLSNVFEVLVPLIIREAVNGLQEGATVRAFFGYGAMIIGVTAVSGVFSFFTRQTIIVASRKMEFELRNDFYAHLQTLSISFYNNTTTGDLMAHTTNDINQVRNFLGPGIMYSTSTFIGFVIILGIMLSINPVLTLLALLPLPLISVIVFYIGGIVHKKTIRIQEQFSDITSRAQENLSGIRVIKAFTREHYEIGQFENLGREYYRRNMSLIRVQSLTRPVLYLLVGISLIVVLWYGGLSIIDGRMTLGDVTAMMIYLGMLIWPMIAFGWVFNIIQRAAASMGRLNKIFDMKPEIKDGDETDYSIRELRGDIRFKNVTFTYGAETPPVLKNIELDVPAGKTIGVIGFTGSGKTTLVSLIPRLYDIGEGELLIDGYPIKQIPIATLRSHIGYVPQETFLFSESIRENISFGQDSAEDHLVERVSDIAHLSGDVEDFPKKFDTVIGERGITLSGGQKQRASLARALARDPKILILDDAFSAVDTYTEEAILSRLRDEIRERTTFLISHRISTVKQADEIIVLDSGLIVERGSHDELVERGGIYAGLHQKQLLEKELEEM
jgi:ATP-binding cassette, subfamily B, multidrug efflux pump